MREEPRQLEAIDCRSLEVNGDLNNNICCNTQQVAIIIDKNEQPPAEKKPIVPAKEKFKLSFQSLLCCCKKADPSDEGKVSNLKLQQPLPIFFLQNDLDLAKEVNIKEHLFTLAELEEKFQTNLQAGLTSSEAEIRLKRDGPNGFTPPKTTPAWVLLLKELTMGFAAIMWLAVILR